MNAEPIPIGTTRAVAHAADRLLDAVKRRAAPVCVGLDPVVARLPAALTPHGDDRASGARAIGDFSRHVLDAVADHVPCVKIQAACFERFGPPGLEALEATIEAAVTRDLCVILDAKRGDIGVSAEHYAAAAFPGEATRRPDWITVNAWFGADGLEPFLARGGAFALVRTSNPGGDAVQGAAMRDGSTVAEHLARIVAEIGRDHRGASGFSTLGAVVGATKARDAERLRMLMPEQVFLVPGFGAQGGGIDDVRPCFDASGRGAIVTASRSVIYAFAPGAPAWTACITDAARRLADDVGAAVGLR